MTQSRPLVKKPMPTQARGLETRARLLDAGRRAFAELGHDGVNLERDVLEVAGVGFGSFYHQFNDKTELLLAVLESASVLRTETVMLNGFLSPTATTLTERLTLGLRRLFDSFDDEEHAWRVSLQTRESSNPRIKEFVLAGRERWIARLADMLAADPDTTDTSPRLTAEVLVTTAAGAASLYLGVDDARTRSARREEILHAMTRFIIAGVQNLT